MLSLLLRRFVFRVAEASAKRVTGDEPQGTMGRVQTAGCLLPAFLCAYIFIKRETSGYEAGICWSQLYLFLNSTIFSTILTNCSKIGPASYYGGSEVTCRKPDNFLLAATIAASLILLRLFYHLYCGLKFCTMC